MRTNKVISLSQFIADQQNKFPDASGDLSKIFRDFKFAAKIVNRDVRKAGLVDVLGAFGTVNVQGEEVKKLDMIANEEFKIFINAWRRLLCNYIRGRGRHSSNRNNIKIKIANTLSLLTH